MKLKILLFAGLLALLLPLHAHAASVLAEESERDDFEQEDVQAPIQAVPLNTQNNAVNAPGSTVNSNTAPAPAISSSFPWAWTVTRSAGIASYLLLGILTISGILLSTGLFFRIFDPATAWSIHRAIASVLLVSVLLHVGALLFDHFIGLHILDVLVPFVSSYRPALVALGIAGFYLLLLLLITSLYTMTKHPRFWRIVHYSGFIMFSAIFVHGLLIGTDMKLAWIKAIYWIMAVLVLAAVIYRLWWRHRGPQLDIGN
ncbi:MAG: hypothetical protein WCV50_04760 [Patescibacteria group bacterium]|jgi:hypothetical protein